MYSSTTVILNNFSSIVNSQIRIEENYYKYSVQNEYEFSIPKGSKERLKKTKGNTEGN